MKAKSVLLGLSLVALPVLAQTPVYLDDSKPVEERVEDACLEWHWRKRLRSRMHSLNSVLRAWLVWESLSFGWQTALTAYVPKCYGMNGTRQDGPMTLVWLFRHWPVWPLPGIPICLCSMAKASVRKRVIAIKPCCWDREWTSIVPRWTGAILNIWAKILIWPDVWSFLMCREYSRTE